LCFAVTAPRSVDVVETLAVPGMAELCRRAAAPSRADILELRLDALTDRPDAAAVLQSCSRPAIVTCRPQWEGGGFRGSELERERVLEAALAGGAAFVDVEWAAPFRDRLLTQAAERVVLSAHAHEGIPADLSARVLTMAETRAAVVKVAVQAHRLRDLLPLLDIARRRASRRKMVVIAMGAAGVASRIAAARFNSCWTYAGEAVAPGQLPLSRLLDEFRVDRIGPGTMLYGLLGRPIGHSLSPAMHNAAFAALGVDAAYVPLEALDFADFQAVSDALGVVGVSVTAPFKQDAWAACRRMEDAARHLGAVNTLRRDSGGAWEGRNTDMAGFMAPLAGVPLRGRRATVVGAGGAARAVAQALADAGAAVTIRGRRPAALRAVAGLMNAEAGELPVPEGSWDILVNATPVGTWPDAESSPMERASLDGELVYDLVYNPPETRLMRLARAAGCRVIGGLDMLVAQAAHQVEWWTGLAAPQDAMREAALARLDAQVQETERA
jgi:3-dehydroquinate dehydratase/shikimate dehydrogenase